MEKDFNVTDKCIVSRHYMANVSKKLGETVKMVDKGLYFIINRPRQYGKTTMLNTLEDVLRARGDYFVFSTYNEHKYIIELKRWYGEVYHEKGVKQLCNYLDIQEEKTGFLVIFEYNKVKSWHKEWIERDGKRIFAVWV